MKCFNDSKSFGNLDTMIKIPFDSCVIVSTLDFLQITQRLESAIYVSSEFEDRSELARIDDADTPDLPPSKQAYFGQIQGFKFSATRLVGHKYFHLPAFLFPTIEGDINGLHHGYQIEIGLKLHNITFALMLTLLGGLLATIGPALDNILGGSKNYQYLTTLQIFALIYVAILVHFYVDALRAKKFFRNLFVKGFVLVPQVKKTAQLPDWSGWLFQDAGNITSTQLLRKNLPSFPRKTR
jgi:hypothetical protein